MKVIYLKLESTTCEGNVSFIQVKRGSASLFSRSDVRQKFNSITDDAAELRFKLEAAENAEQAIAAVNKFCKNKTVTSI
jgi:hypothetical protein